MHIILSYFFQASVLSVQGCCKIRKTSGVPRGGQPLGGVWGVPKYPFSPLGGETLQQPMRTNVRQVAAWPPHPRATTRVRPYYTTDRPAKPVYSRGGVSPALGWCFALQ